MLSEWKKQDRVPFFFRSDLHMCLGGRGEMRDTGFAERVCTVGRRKHLLGKPLTLVTRLASKHWC